MTFAELTAIVEKAPELVAAAAAAGIAVSVAVGALGTQLENLGAKLGLLWLERLGQRLEAVGSDLPKLRSGSRYTNDILARVEAGLKMRDQGAP